MAKPTNCVPISFRKDRKHGPGVGEREPDSADSVSEANRRRGEVRRAIEERELALQLRRLLSDDDF